jgi:hypothetical protein
MLKRQILILASWLLVPLLVGVASGHAWECADDAVPFTHKPSDYYGSGEYFATCPETGVQIRCYHYHRHWVCEKGDVYFWDRNLDVRRPHRLRLPPARRRCPRFPRGFNKTGNPVFQCTCAINRDDRETIDPASMQGRSHSGGRYENPI